MKRTILAGAVALLATSGLVGITNAQQPPPPQDPPAPAGQQVTPTGDFELTATPPCDDRSHGVFATRSPRRPNPIGLTVVELLRRDGRSLHVRGVDMLDGTPILDIKPYLSSIPQDVLRLGWLAEAERRADT